MNMYFEKKLAIPMEVKEMYPLDLKSQDIIDKRNVEINRRPKENNKEYKYIEEALEEKLGTKVKILNGKIQINYSSINDLNRIMEILNINIEE